VSFVLLMRSMDLEVIRANYLRRLTQVKTLTDEECLILHDELKKDYALVFNVLLHEGFKKFKKRRYNIEKYQSAIRLEQVLDRYDRMLLPRVNRIAELCGEC
jgi:hypothetical protein